MTPEPTDWSRIPIDTLVPHQGGMSFLRRVLRCEGEELEAEACISQGQLFMNSLGEGEGLGSWVGIELMAQAVAAWAGVQGRAQGIAPRIGLLLGCRKYRTTQARFKVGDRLRVLVRREFQADNGLGQFACQLLLCGEQADEPVAQAVLTVFGPENPQEFLQESGHHE